MALRAQSTPPADPPASKYAVHRAIITYGRANPLRDNDGTTLGPRSSKPEAKPECDAPSKDLSHPDANGDAFSDASRSQDSLDIPLMFKSNLRARLREIDDRFLASQNAVQNIQTSVVCGEQGSDAKAASDNTPGTPIHHLKLQSKSQQSMSSPHSSQGEDSALRSLVNIANV